MKNMNQLKSLTAAILTMMSSATTHVYAQDSEVDSLRKEVLELRMLLEKNIQNSNAIQPQLKQAPAPHPSPEKQSLLTKSGAEFSLYGNVRADVSYQAEGTSRDLPYNHINAVALKGTNENSDRLRSTVAATRLGFDFKTATENKDVKGKIEVDFLCGANFDALRIRHAYLNYGNWLIGQTWSNFALPDYMPETIDALAFVGGAVKRTPQVRYTAPFNAKTNLVLAAEDPKDSAINQRMPPLTARLNHQIADNLNLSIRAMGHEKRVNSDEEMAWGVGVGAKYDVVPGTTLKADYYHVKGDSSFVSFTNKGIVTQANGDLALIEFDSIMLGITQKFSDIIHGTLGYGYMSFNEDQNYINALADKTVANKELWQAWANIFYSPRKPLSFGLEYVYGEREAFGAAPNGSKTGVDNRVNAVAMYNF